MQLEDGEIEDDSVDGLDPYTPLERPTLNTEVKHLPQEESDKESEGKYSSDSDSDDGFRPKKPKMRRLINPPRKPSKSKYSVWCKESNEHLTDFLCSFGMRNPENDRNVENYTVPFVEDRKRKLPTPKFFKSAKLKSIFLDELEASEMSTFETLASDIASKLSESNYDLVLRIVVICGKEKAIEFYNRTREIESDGGMLIANKSRRRTSGGIFILLVRTNKDISFEKKLEIFEDSRERTRLNKHKLKKRERQRKYKAWLKKMNYDKEMESGQEELNNPPPSPEHHCPDPLPELRLRREILSYSDLNLNHSTDSEEGRPEENHHSELSEKGEAMNFQSLHTDVASPKSSPKQNVDNSSCCHNNPTDSPLKRDVVNYEDLCSMELIYD